MSTGSQPHVETRRLEGARQQIDFLIKKLAHLAEQDLAPAEFYGPFLQAILEALAAPAGVVWNRTAQGNLGLQYQINFRQIGLDEDEDRRREHDELLRQVLQQGRPVHVLPQSSATPAEPGKTALSNPTDYLVMLAPMWIDQQVAGLLEVWHRPNLLPGAVPGSMQFLMAMAELASGYCRNLQRRRMVVQEQLWHQLEGFTLQVQGSLNPTEVSYLVANEGRRLLECDRLSVAVRHGKRAVIEAISGVDVIERRSKQVRHMRTLCQSVLAWNEKLVFRGTPDETLPAPVVKSLDAYLEESACKLLVILPLRDPREKESKKPARSALLLESFEPTESPEQMIGRLEVVGKHATRALYNASEYRRIPCRWLWRPVTWIQDGLGVKARAIMTLVVLGLALLVGMLIFVPYPLKMEAKGQLLPEERRWVYSPVEAHVIRIPKNVQPGAHVAKNQPLILMYDLQLDIKMHQLEGDIEGAQAEVDALAGQLNAASTEAERRRISTEQKTKERLRDSKRDELKALRDRTHADEAQAGLFWLRSPLDGTVLNWGFEENLTNRFVKPSDPLLRIGNKDKPWEIELKIPQKHIGQVLKAFDTADPKAELDVDLLVLSAPTRIFKGKLARDKIAGEASPSREEGTESAEPVVLASVRINGPDIAEADRIPQELLVSGTEVHSKIRCGNRAMGYSLFYGIWEFMYDKVVFFF